MQQFQQGLLSCRALSASTCLDRGRHFSSGDCILPGNLRAMRLLRLQKAKAQAESLQQQASPQITCRPSQDLVDQVTFTSAITTFCISWQDCPNGAQQDYCFWAGQAWWPWY